MNNTKLLDNLKTLQDLKFEIYNRSTKAIDYRNFNVLTLNLPNKTIDIADFYKKHYREYSIEEIAGLIVAKYEL
ncbi:hypothetical protein [Companilactobacillus nodensis]|uniref:Uncharacterized protein n=1 Tax=Companilactobacillus nodensis DSM 19682 = JCM 14932 = NBRC 107160 TaxID=1423775 RepID=A0A0R1K8U7_9LACO|nr:hypothetical protein [Companilactobacillus nodensis]KRK79736.1 hypothetical protein FD03_GL000437 [Companilactobacillus nodensis DSM 19682 = JCM 14932 = NBRC 107160]